MHIYYFQNWKNFLNMYTLFAFIFLFHFFFIFQGIDLTDFGYHATQQISAVTLPINVESVSPLVFFTNLMGGLWLSIPGTPNVIWARLGGVFLISLIAVIVYSILCNYFNKNLVFGIVFISTIFITMHTLYYIIHYYLFPAFLIAIELFLINRLMNCQEDARNSKIYAFSIGFITVAIILSRVTLFLNIIIPIFILVYLVIIKENIQRFYKSIYFIIFGVMVSVIFFGILYYVLGIFFESLSYIYSIFLDSFTGTSTLVSRHSVNGLFSLYLSEYKQVFFDLLYPILFVCIVYLLLMIKWKNIPRYLLNYFIYFFSLTSMLFFIYLVVSSKNIHGLSLRIIKDTIGVTIIASCYFIWNYAIKNKKIAILLIVSLIAMIINPIGSNNGIFNSIDGMWLILPLCILISYQRINELDLSDRKPLLFTIAIIMISMMIIAIFFHFTYIYRDDPNRFNLNTEFTYPALQGVYSTPDRVQMIDDVLFYINKNTRRGDEILIVNSIPLLYYLSETRPALGNPWVFQNLLSKIKIDQIKLEKEYRYPEFFIFSKVDPRDPYWPNTKKIASWDDPDKLYYLKNRYIDNINYSLVWENRAFAVYKRPDVIYSYNFYPTEHWGNISARWLSNNSTIIVYSKQQNSVLQFNAISYRQNRMVTISINNHSIDQKEIKTHTSKISLPLTLIEGRNIITFSVSPDCKSPHIFDSTSKDNRCLSIAITDVSVS